MNNRYLFLDDIRSPSCVNWIDMPDIEEERWDIVRNFDEFVSYIQTQGLPEHISFDHDLAIVDENGNFVDNVEIEKTGHDCAKWLVDYCLDNIYSCPSFSVHSQNPAGKANIEGLLNGFVKFQENNRSVLKNKMR